MPWRYSWSGSVSGVGERILFSLKPGSTGLYLARGGINAACLRKFSIPIPTPISEQMLSMVMQIFLCFGTLIENENKVIILSLFPRIAIFLPVLYI